RAEAVPRPGARAGQRLTAGPPSTSEAGEHVQEIAHGFGAGKRIIRFRDPVLLPLDDQPDAYVVERAERILVREVVAYVQWDHVPPGIRPQHVQDRQDGSAFVPRERG